MDSCIYEGRVRHKRTEPALHQFEYRLFMMYLDLDELPSCVRDLVEKESGERPSGPIRLLTNLSYFGYCFNPVSFYYCFEADGETIGFIVAEVNNTPWGERDCYVMSCRGGEDGPWRFQPHKKMHVSPFMPMDVQYEWALSRPAGRLNVHMANLKNGKRFFDAGMSLRQRPISGRSLGTILLRFPFLTAKIILAIHFEALRLWLKRCPFYEHPKKRKEVVAR
jgi:DUF1365 family protein